MPNSPVRRLCAHSVCWLLLLSTLLAFSLQAHSLQDASQAVPQRPHRPTPDEIARQQMEKEMAKKANQERQADLKRDTDQLLQLATELKSEVDKSTENLLSVEVVKKAEEIEKLAHSVKEKMKGN